MGKVVKKPVVENLHARRMCGTCEHWERYPDVDQAAGEDVVGECCLYPPKVIDMAEDGLVVQACPVLTYRERCGQHCPKVN